MRRTSLFVALLGLLWAAPAQAHFPYLSDGEYGAPETAFEIEDIDVSMVLYHIVGCDALQLWLSFEAEAGHPLIAQLAIPKLDRLADYRPSFAVIGPGLPQPEVDLPFEMPEEGLGAWVYDTSDIAEPEYFFEPFSQTESWILVKIEEEPLADAGRYYLVAWVPSRMTGKLWVTAGIEEDFSGINSQQEFQELINGVKAFHEVEGELDVEEEYCAPPADPEPAADVAPSGDESDAAGETVSAGTDTGPPSGDGGGGCSSAGEASPSAAGLALLSMLALGLVMTGRRGRRRSHGAAA